MIDARSGETWDMIAKQSHLGAGKSEGVRSTLGHGVVISKLMDAPLQSISDLHTKHKRSV